MHPVRRVGVRHAHWPAEYGAGLSLAPGQAKHVNEVLDRYKVARPFNIIGLGMGGPTLVQWGSEEQKQALLRGIATNEEIWCQLFSEPGAGSDVAGLATRAVRDGDEWVVNGQKVWTTLAHLSRWGMLLARTDPDVPKQRGMTYFVVDMHAPGVEVRPLVQMTGDAEFNEVFFHDARIPDSMRVGPVGDGWHVGITTLMDERVALSGAGSLSGEVGGSGIDRLIGRHRPVSDALLRQQLAPAYIENWCIRLDNRRAADRRRSGAEAGPEGSITKLMQAEYNQRLQKLAVGTATLAGTQAVGIVVGVANPLDRDGAPLSLLTVHAHPDDEASKGSATVARYADEGVQTSLVCCTGGEAGDVLNPAVDTPEVRENLAAVRLQELERSAAAIGYGSVHLLGYHDSGMPDSEDNARPDNFANAPLDEAIERLVAFIRLERPQVIVTYADDREFYPHPDHIRVHEISLPAFDLAGDPDAFPSAGAPWMPSKLYYTGWSRSRVQALHDEFLRRGEESPYAHWFERELPEHAERFTTFVEVGDWLHRRRAALLAHRTQVDPAGFWMRLPDATIRQVFPWEEFLLARSRVDNGVAEGDTEDDLFAGLRADAAVRRA